MLYLTRKIGETIMINENIEITVVSVSGKSVKLGLKFPESITILRKEVFDRIQEENRAAAEIAFLPPDRPLILPDKPFSLGKVTLQESDPHAHPSSEEKGPLSNPNQTPEDDSSHV